MKLQKMLMGLVLGIAGCNRHSTGSDPVFDLSKPDNLPADVIQVSKTPGFSPEVRAESKMGPETVWAGYSKAFTIEVPVSLAVQKKPTGDFTAGSFYTVSGGSVSFLVLDPVDYKLEGIVPKKYLSDRKTELLSRTANSSDSSVLKANEWIGSQWDSLSLKGEFHARYLFFSDRDSLQVSFRWKEGDKRQEEECAKVLADGLWSLKVVSEP